MTGHGTYRELLTKDNMDIISSISLTNRSVTQFEELVEELIANSDISKQLRTNMRSLHAHILNKKHDGHTVEYILTNQPGYWIERITLKEDPFEAAELLVAICDMERNITNDIKYSTVSEVVDFISKIKDGDDYTSVLFTDVIFQFILDCSEYLKDTHNLEIKITQEMLYFEAIPRGKGTSIVVISQSDNTILVRNLNDVAELAGMDYEEESLLISKGH